MYSIGFARGMSGWGRFLNPGGLLVVSEITWTTATSPAELQRHRQTRYAEMNRASAKIALLEQHGDAPTRPLRLWDGCGREGRVRTDTVAELLRP